MKSFFTGEVRLLLSMKRNGNQLGLFFIKKNICGSYVVYKVYWKKAKESFAKEENEDAWFNNRILDGAQKLICKALGKIDSFQSVPNSQKKEITHSGQEQRAHTVARGRKQPLASFFLFQWPYSDLTA